MSDDPMKRDNLPADGIFAADGAAGHEIPIWAVEKDASLEALPLSAAQRTWIEGVGFKGTAKQQTLLPGADGRVAGVLFGIGDGSAGEPSGPSELLIGHLAQSLPDRQLSAGERSARSDARRYRLGSREPIATPATRTATRRAPVSLRLPDGADRELALSTIEAVRLGRDLINTPASDLGPAEIEAAARDLAMRFGAHIEVTVGDDLLAKNFPMIHAVGRASPRAPRLIDISWGREGARTVTLVGKGITFDTGGLDIKPSSAMLLMKKDMGGAAAALTLGHMIMAQKLDVRLRILIPTAENSISGDAFRPGDVLTSRAGKTVEIGNTDAEGRLVLADAIALADEQAPQSMFVFATLTGAARVALGPDLPAMFTNDDAFAAEMVATSAGIGDPVWRLPLWPGYDAKLDSAVADMNNVWEAPFAGVDHRRAVPEAVRQAGQALRPLRPVRLAAGRRARSGRGAASRKRRAPCSRFWPRSFADERYG